MVQQEVAVPMFYVVRQIATRSMPHQLQKDVAAASGIILPFHEFSNLYKVLTCLCTSKRDQMKVVDCDPPLTNATIVHAI